MARLQGWEGRLNELVQNADSKKYQLGEHDCFRFACEVIQALTGVDRWQEFEGKYSTRDEALELIYKKGETFETAGDWFFGAHNSIHRNYAQRGDICAVAQNDEKHLGVCVGNHIVMLSENGILLLPLKQALRVWKVGRD